MPTSSSGARQTKPMSATSSGGNISSSNNVKRSYWPSSNNDHIISNNNNNNHEQHQASSKVLTSFQQQQKKSAKSSSNAHKQHHHHHHHHNHNHNNLQHQHQHQIKHISPPTSLTSTSVALKNSMAERIATASNSGGHSSHPAGSLSAACDSDHREQQALSLAGHLVTLTTGTGANGKQPNSLGSSLLSHHQETEMVSDSYAATAAATAAATGTNKRSSAPINLLGSGTGTGGCKSSFLISNSQYAHSSANIMNKHNSQNSLQQQPPTTNSSTAQLHNPSGRRSSTPLSMKRTINLKYIKTLIILLMAIDLLITVFVHQFSSQDHLSLWFTSYKLRLSLLNLILSSGWFIILIGAILFDIYFILLISCFIHVASFVLLLALSIIHFTRKIDYSTINLTSLLALLFSVIMLHIYLVIMAALTAYLTIAVRRRQRLTTAHSHTNSR